ncbi:hypothetical protein GCM10009837_64180 [Streptomyces durmitorensis]|uniref:Uncharacterized protein n=1 Tax=Streptomyces durmitorensis TaxID=319947 RepID=A0ABY4PTF6_9ACTN|nr:hypothetical protein [Streptomyces durmitorensis]UQT57031.1 hypothetical protein M4V62_19050 [Streptomyces durmitorensis]
MPAPTSTSARQTPDTGTVRLFAPDDWFDLAADIDEEAAHARCTDLIDRSYPHREPGLRADFTAALMAWRQALREQGVIMYGLVTVPDSEAGPAVWQIMATVVEVPRVGNDLDLGEVVSRLLGQELTGRLVYTEAYPTRMGVGLGVISQPSMSPDGELALFPHPDLGGDDSHIGLALSLSCPPSGGRGLLVVGNCLESEQVVALAGVVALIGGNSTFDDEGPSGNEASGHDGPSEHHGPSEHDGPPERHGPSEHGRQEALK